jgi:hypothetical protein
MALQKQPVNINFAQGLDTKTDPYQVSIGNFLSLNNSVFTAGGRLTKRNGFPQLTVLPNKVQTNITTFDNNLIATGSDLYSYSADTKQWFDKGSIQPVQLSVIPTVRDSYSQSSPDQAVAANNLVCTAFVEQGNAYYNVTDSSTGTQIISKTAIGSGASDPRVILLGAFFVITFTYLVLGTPNIGYIAISTSNPTIIGTITNISSVVSSQTAPYDIFVINDLLYVVWNAGDATIKLKTISANLTQSTATTLVTAQATFISICATAVNLWLVYQDSSTSFIKVIGYSIPNFVTPIVTSTNVTSAPVTIRALSSIVDNSNVLNIFYEIKNTYSAPYPNAGIYTDYICSATVTTVGVIVASTTPILRSVGLASKPLLTANGTIYMIVAYGDTNATQSPVNQYTNEPSYFLMDSLGNIYMRLAYSNGGGYVQSFVLPTINTVNGNYYVSYLFADFLATVNKNTNITPTPSTVNAIYTQFGVNLATFTINDSKQYSSEIAGSLFLTGGQLWQYDGVKPVEQGFQVWPENVADTTTTTGGSIAGGANAKYFYQFTYEWTDGAGQLQRSAPSVPIEVDLTGSGTSTNVNTLYVPTLRLTYKTGNNPVRIVGYRWSVLQPVYYQFTSITSPTLNDPTVDYVTITDTQSDAQILGQTILYTTGGVVENIAAPASIASCLYGTRLFVVDAEDQNLIRFSKQVIENVPVEMSDFFTLYIPPTTGAQGSTGPITALSAMDDKLIIFKKDAIYYITGTGPDNTGANNDFSSPVFITAAVGCSNPNSIVLMPTGIMFQSDKGIWLLGRDLSTTYIGAGVEAYNSQTVSSALTIPGTNQVRFTISNNTTLMYDYFYNQWGTFSNLQAISATLYNGYHTYLNVNGAIYQELPGTYIDGTSPVLMSFTTPWINLAGLQGFQRLYFIYLLGTYFSPYTLQVGIAYNYNPGIMQNIAVYPDNFTPNWGGDSNWGSNTNWGGGQGTQASSDGGAGNVFAARLFPNQGKCESVQLTLTEVYDPSFGVPAGQGLSLSGLNVVIGQKRGYRTQRASRSFG